MTRVFGRRIEVTFTDPTGEEEQIIPDARHLNIGFTVERNLDVEASTAELTFFNLSQDTQNKLSRMGRPLKRDEQGELVRPDVPHWTVEIAAGYFDPRATGRKPGEFGTHTIFKGDVRRVQHRREPPVLATDVEADDGGDAAAKFVTKHFGAGTSVGTVFKWLQEQSTLGAGNVTRITQIKSPKGIPNRIKSGMTIRGYAMEELNDLARSRGALVSSQGGELIVLKPGEALPNVPTTKISADTGLIGYPYQDAEGVVVLNHKMLPNVFPGAPLEIESEFVNLTIVVERAVYSGSLFGDDFNIEVEGRQQVA
jgi:hypothetical protein